MLSGARVKGVAGGNAGAAPACRLRFAIDPAGVLASAAADLAVECVARIAIDAGRALAGSELALTVQRCALLWEKNRRPSGSLCGQAGSVANASKTMGRWRFMAVSSRWRGAR